MQNKIKKYEELVIGIVFSVLSAAYYLEAAQLPKSKLFSFGAGFVPKIYGVGLFLLSMGFIFAGIRKIRNAGNREPDVPEQYPAEYDRVLRVSVVFIAYILLWNWIGFVISTFFFMFIEMILFAPDGKKNMKNLILYFVISLVMTVALYYIFRNGFHVLLPEGILKSLTQKPAV